MDLDWLPVTPMEHSEDIRWVDMVELVFAAPRSPWNGPRIVGLRRCLVPSVNAPFHPGYLNGGVGGYVGMTTGPIIMGSWGPDTNGKWNRAKKVVICNFQQAHGQ
ncbi:hypothetical protein IFM89_000384 [Coptis chinensis]|uniref:Uncharacterized protein n=1 Tax=Coptis chinensis TaxID=261450 RepID=A0A835LQ42_9MAGN|nr:hypothetical protein IFM89_000384 [Coptis chinensis]